MVNRSVDQISCDIGFDRSPSGRVTKKCHTTSPVPSPNVSLFHISCLSFYFLTLFSLSASLFTPWFSFPLSASLHISSFTFRGSLHTPPFLPACLELRSSFLTFFFESCPKKHSHVEMGLAKILYLTFLLVWSCDHSQLSILFELSKTAVCWCGVFYNALQWLN